MKDSDKEKLIKDIADRNFIINQYKLKGNIDRAEAIRKINELRISNKVVATITATKLLSYSVTFDCATDEQIIAELKMQVDILNAELLEKFTEENNEH